MAFPTVATPRGTSGALASSTTHAVTMPGSATTARGVLVVTTWDSAPTASTVSSGWTKIAQTNAGSGSMGSALFYKRPGVTLAALSITLSFAEEGTYVVLVFDDAEPSENVTATAATAITANGNPPSHTPAGGARDYLWIAAHCNESLEVATAAPASYSNLTAATGGASGASTATAERSLNAASENPGAFTSPAEDHVAWTIAVPPLAATDVAVDTPPSAGVLHGSPAGESVEALSINVALDTDPTAATVASAPAGETVSVDLTDPTPAATVHGAPGGELVSVSLTDPTSAAVAVRSPAGETVDAEEPGLPAGGSPFVSLWAVDPDTGGLIRLPHALQVDLSPVRNQAGAFRFDYPAYGRNFDILHSRLVEDQVGLELELWVGGSRFNSLGGDVLRAEGDDVAEDSVWSFSGKFFTHRLSRAVVVHDPAADKGERRFGAATAGTIMRTFLQEAQARGTLTELSFATFSTTHDSAGVPWARTVTLKFTPYGSGGLLAVLARLVDLGLCEGEVDRDKRLLLYNAGGAGRDLTTRTPPTILRRGKDLLESNRRIDVEEAGTDLFGTGAEGLYASTFDATARAKWDAQIEKVIDSNQIEDQAALTAFVQNAREQAVLAPMELTHGLVFGSNRPAPVSGFRINDWLYSDVGRGLERVRVAQWVLSQDVSGITGSVTLNDVIADRLTRLARRLAAMSDGSAVVGTSQPPTAEDTLAPAAPTGVTVDSLAYTEGLDTYATLLVGWNQVTTNASGPVAPKAQAAQLILERMQSGAPIFEDWTWSGMPALVGVWNDALLAEFDDSGESDAEAWLADYVDDNSVTGTAADDIAGYRVQWRPQSEGADSWRLGIDVAGGAVTSTSFGGVGAGIDVLVRVAAYDTDGNQSAWSSEVVILTATDDDAPPTPSTPGAFPYLGQIKVTYDGKGSAGEAMPLDTELIELHKSLASGFTATDATAVDTFSPNILGERVLTDLAYGVTVFVRLVARDRAGNRSAMSAQASATPEKVVGDDVFDGAIGSAKLANLAVITAKMDNLAVNDAKFGSGSVGKLEAGILSVAVTNAGIVRSGTTGQRYELDAASLRFYNSAGTQTVQLNGAWNWISGEIRTALTGQRFVLNPGGTAPSSMRGYPTSGSTFAEIRVDTVGGRAVLEMYADRDDRSGFVGLYATEAFIKWGDDGATPSRSAVSCAQYATTYWGPSVAIEVRGDFPNDGGTRRIELRQRNSSGVIKSGSVLYYQESGVGQAQIYNPFNDLAITWANNSIEGIYIGDAAGLMSPITALDNLSPSSRSAKKGEKPIRFGTRTALDVVAAVESKSWNYDFENTTGQPAPGRKFRTREERRDGAGQIVRGPDGEPMIDEVEREGAPQQTTKPHFFPIAEDLLAVAPDLVRESSIAPGGLVIGQRDTLGLLWQAVRELNAKVDAGPGRP